MKKNKLILLMLGLCFAFTSQAQTTTINGLTIIVSYTDYPFNATVADVSAMMNQPTGYTNWGNNGSVKQYYTVQTNGKIEINSQVLAVSVPNTFAYYHNNKEQLLRDLVANINASYPSGFTNLSVHPTENRIRHFLVLSRGSDGDGVSFGFDYGLSVLNNGISLPIGNAAFAGWLSTDQPEINVICHEMGHSVFGWTDFYITEKASGTNLGHYCLMASGGRAGGPMPINPGLRNFNQWITTVNEINNNTTQTYSVVANNSNQIYKYTNAFNPKEYFLITAYVQGGYYVAVDGDGYTTDQGLAIWYVDEDGGLDKPNPGAVNQLRIRLVQADGMDEMNDRTKTHHDWRGDDTDLFDNNYTFSDAAYPAFRWKDGSETGLNISNISAIGATMTFNVNARPGTISISPSVNGKTVPSGLVAVAAGQSKTVSFVPDLGYAVDQVTLNGISQGAITSYTFPTVSGTQNIAVTFKKSSAGYALPSPWLSGDIGSPATASVSGYKNGTFGITTYGSDIYWGNDQFHYIYQPVSGNAEIIARVASNNLPDQWSKFGIMIRESLASDAKEVMLVRTPWNGLANQFRLTTAGGSDNYNEDTLKSIVWLKLNRNGSTITSSYSRDGNAWTTFHSVTVSMQQNIYVGLCAAGINNSIANKSTYDHVSVNGVLANFAPTVAITSPANNAVFTAPASITINANAADTDGTVSKVEFYQGLTYLGTDYSSPYSFTWSSVAAGSYTIRAAAYDNQNASTSATVNIVVNGTTTCTAPAWSASTVYTSGNAVQYNGIKYIANWWTQNENPSTHNGGSGSGQPWTSQGTCNSRTSADENVAVNSNALNIAPNPVLNASIVFIELTEDEEQVSLDIMDSFGKKIATVYHGALQAGGHALDMNSSPLTPGVYILSLKSQRNNQNKVFIKQ